MEGKPTLDQEHRMPEMRRVSPKSLTLNPNNPRRTPAGKEMDAQLVASILAIGLIQPPVVREIDGKLVVRAGDRRTKAAIKAGLKEIDVYVIDGDETHDPMTSMSENLVRVSMNPVDTWRGIQGLEQQEWNEEAIAGALAIPARTVRKLKLLGSLHPPMLDVMAKGSMPSDDQLRTIAAASAEEQEEVWKAHKPKKGHDVVWWEVARSLTKRRISFSAAQFDEQAARDNGVTWEEDLFAPAGQENRYTTNLDGFLAAQQAHMQAAMPDNGTLLTVNDHGTAQLPKGAERVYSDPKPGDVVGHFVDERSGEIQTVAYRLPTPKVKSRVDVGETGGGQNGAAEESAPVVVKIRPDVTQKGMAMIGEFRTDALHTALGDSEIPIDTLLGILVIALAGKNISVQSPAGYGGTSRLQVLASICEGGVLSTDTAAIHQAARTMLTLVLSCRENNTNSGIAARIAGGALCASKHLAHMGTEEFLACLSRGALEAAAKGENVAPGARVKDTRAALVKQVEGSTWQFRGAHFELVGGEFAAGTHEYRYDGSHFVPGTGAIGDDEGEGEGGDEDDIYNGVPGIAENNEQGASDDGDGEPDDITEAA